MRKGQSGHEMQIKSERGKEKTDLGAEVILPGGVAGGKKPSIPLVVVILGE